MLAYAGVLLDSLGSNDVIWHASDKIGKTPPCRVHAQTNPESLQFEYPPEVTAWLVIMLQLEKSEEELDNFCLFGTLSFPSGLFGRSLPAASAISSVSLYAACW